jgi:hypothetical protein
MKVSCGQCGGVFSKPPSHVKRVERVFCSSGCHNLFQSSRITKSCVICESSFAVAPSQAARYSVCSESCRLENKKKFRNPNWRGGKKRQGNPITDNIRNLYKYSQWRTGILEQRGVVCEICGSNENIQVHHIAFAKYHPWYMLEPSNGMVLCRIHHQQLHRESRQMGESIAVDLDGTLAIDPEGEFDPEFIGEPVPIMLARVKNWIEKGETVKIFTARAHDSRNIPPIVKWLEKHGIGGLEITNQKTPDMKAIWDDRGRQVIPNTGKSPNKEMFSLFRQLEKESAGSKKRKKPDPNSFELMASLEKDSKGE